MTVIEEILTEAFEKDLTYFDVHVRDWRPGLFATGELARLSLEGVKQA